SFPTRRSSDLRSATRPANHLIPALKRRANLIPTLRVEDPCSEVPAVRSNDPNHTLKSVPLRLPMLNGFQKRLQLSRPRGMAQLSQRFGLDLTNTFASHRKMLPDFFQRMFRSGRAQTKTHLDHLLFARR